MLGKLTGLILIAGAVRSAAFAANIDGTLQEDFACPAANCVIIREVIWGSRFLTRHALVERYQDGRILLAGDSAHVRRT